jgi:SP family general alpha glucoside:H+ symporter-like MFS transporter
MSTSTISIATFQRDFGYEFEGEYIISSRWQIGFNSASYVGQSFGAIISGYMADRVGKRLTMGMACLLSIVAVFVQVFARSSVVLLIGKVHT